ncbi:hypothetical protein GCM10023147_08010 [Tsukamurella soli]|uniref:Lipoprotein LpqN n=1 Tax=Tsukamurella soli TaxID=644556 RepID=A0ABP8J679_9ACTN
MPAVRSGAEPRVDLPIPAGWHAAPLTDGVRAAVVDPAHRAGGVPPEADVVIRDDTGSRTPRAVIDDEIARLRAAATAAPSVSRGTACGFPSAVVSYSTAAAHSVTPAQPSTSLIVAVPEGRRLYAVVVTIRTADASSPAYLRDSSTVLGGVHVATA